MRTKSYDIRTSYYLVFAKIFEAQCEQHCVIALKLKQYHIMEHCVLLMERTARQPHLTFLWLSMYILCLHQASDEHSIHAVSSLLSPLRVSVSVSLPRLSADSGNERSIAMRKSMQ